METIKEKYARLRPFIRNGDIINVRGTSLLAKTIQWSDKAYFNHSLVVQKVDDRIELAVQSLANGAGPMYLSTEIYQNVDFTILRPQKLQDIIDANVILFAQAVANGIGYNYWQLPKILIKEKLGFNTNLGNDKTKDICSMLAASKYGGLYPFRCYANVIEKDGYITPQGLIRFLDPSEIKIIG